jgi:predicted RNA-binding protein YlqC (UPF0109 family)
MKKLIQLLAEQLVDHPDKVIIEEVGGQNLSIFELKVAKEDLGKVIGKNGKTASAIRTILNAASGKTRQRILLEIVE